MNFISQLHVNIEIIVDPFTFSTLNLPKFSFFEFFIISVVFFFVISCCFFRIVLYKQAVTISNNKWQ